MLTDLRALQDRMSYEQQEDFALLHVPLVVILMLSIIGSLIFTALLIATQASQHAHEMVMRERAARARRLRWFDTGSEVLAPSLNGGYHLFLSQ